MNIRRWTFALASLTLAILAFMALLEWSYRLKLTYNAEGNFFDEENAVVYSSQAIMVYGLVAVVFLFLAILLACLAFKK